MSKHRSGSARRRARRIKELEGRLHSFQHRCNEGGSAIDMAISAMHCVERLASACYATELDVNGEELSCLLDMFIVEIEAGRAVQSGPSD